MIGRDPVNRPDLHWRCGPASRRRMPGMSGARDETVADAPPIMGNVPGSYALSVFRERHPVLVR
ncbi:hypothetical protein Msi02_23590 [Microbispora siamensis]|uniref:Uncharacterized protein n=1 Tax=Microbispora siamensis TaxID=564413 RepID=A0ABQ4GJD0_9ACTN|nr:hypothetical protein Msi02_23590 [Microbispora siamensis]